jgi:AraC-like DNA-binding protein
MLFSFSATPDFDFLTQFAQHIGVSVHDDLMIIPKQLGEGYIRRISFGQEFKVTLHRYTLKEDLIIKRNSSGMGNELITLFFYNNEQALGITFNEDPLVIFSQRDNSAIQVTSNDLNSTIRFPANYNVNYLVVAISPTYLKTLLASNESNSVMKTIMTSGNSFLYFENMNAESKLLLKHIASADMNHILSKFYLQIKVQELLYILFYILASRENSIYQSINSADAERLLQIRNELLKDLSVPPVLSELAQIAVMSETKMKQLFRQTFGDTIYNYYQRARMEEAAFMLKQGRRSVAEAGYELGFSNLSHFSRVFQKHYGLNPKRYSNNQ